MKKLILSLLMSLSILVANAQCDWSGSYMKKVNQQQNVYTFGTNIDWNNCIDYWWIVYDHQLKRQDTLQDFNGYSQVQFNVKGKYTVMLHVVDDCNKCDTTFNYEVDITVYHKADVTWNVGAHNCKYYSFEMTEFDTCVEYYYSIYKSDLFDSLYGYWDTAKDLYVWLYNNYDFDEKDLVYYNMTSKRVTEHQFEDSGRHLLIGYWYNKCTQIDTWVMRKLDICPTVPTNGLKPITPSVGGMVRPNPASCEFYITDTRVPMEYMILNTSGTIISVGNTSPFEQTRIESCNWPNGVYYIWIMGLGRELIMIQH